ncbi:MULTISPECIES: hypothetical protein [unclassified Microbacterium]|uniref:hypothetical protein n=1 Tax=unclassified Microbacterium TaxID=2609290 RepID=UPI00214CBA55|nr:MULTISPECIES: hypothetical protein [unclassified Microbacterium]MCR2810958.1 hypothetical protein [Microbacterium sp. zg.B185]WIM19643.1 hypothetical protein QNO12_02215 [Microbacterium sp. zg-B185]
MSMTGEYANFSDDELGSDAESGEYGDDELWIDDLADSLYDDLIDEDLDGMGESFDGDPASCRNVLRWTLKQDYADMADDQIADVMNRMLGSMTPAESLNFAAALNRIGRSATQALSDPTVASIARVALPIAGGAAGTVIGGPIGTSLGSQLGTLAAGSLRSATGGPATTSPKTIPATASPRAAPPASAGAPAAAGAFTSTPPAPGSPSPIAAGSAAAAQGLVLSQQPQMLQGLLAAALGQQGRSAVGGVPVAQLLALLSSVIGQAAADADELQYLSSPASDDESALPDGTFPARSLYTGLIDADNIEITEALQEFT